MTTTGSHSEGRAPVGIAGCRIIELPRVHDERGNLTFVESERHAPFRIQRVYYLYDVPGGAVRAGHGHRRLEQLFVAMSGSFDVTVDDGRRQQRYHLNRSYFGLYVPPMVWRLIDNFSSGSVCMVLASRYYEREDYFYDYDEFLTATREGGDERRPPGSLPSSTEDARSDPPLRADDKGHPLT